MVCLTQESTSCPALKLWLLVGCAGPEDQNRAYAPHREPATSRFRQRAGHVISQYGVTISRIEALPAPQQRDTLKASAGSRGCVSNIWEARLCQLAASLFGCRSTQRCSNPIANGKETTTTRHPRARQSRSTMDGEDVRTTGLRNRRCQQHEDGCVGESLYSSRDMGQSSKRTSDARFILSTRMN
jgi:hypothetical protein